MKIQNVRGLKPRGCYTRAHAPSTSLANFIFIFSRVHANSFRNHVFHYGRHEAVLYWLVNQPRATAQYIPPRIFLLHAPISAPSQRVSGGDTANLPIRLLVLNRKRSLQFHQPPSELSCQQLQEAGVQQPGKGVLGRCVETGGAERQCSRTPSFPTDAEAVY